MFKILLIVFGLLINETLLLYISGLCVAELPLCFLTVVICTCWPPHNMARLPGIKIARTAQIIKVK